MVWLKYSMWLTHSDGGLTLGIMRGDGDGWRFKSLNDKVMYLMDLPYWLLLQVHPYYVIKSSWPVQS